MNMAAIHGLHRNTSVRSLKTAFVSKIILTERDLCCILDGIRRRKTLIQRRRRRRQCVTLIAAFRTSEGVVICADSQETLGNPTPQGYENYRCSVNKLQPQTDGAYHWVCGGSGDGDLVDDFVDRLKGEIGSWSANLDFGEIKSKLRLTVLDYRRNEVAASGLAHEPLKFLICIKHQDSTSEPLLFKASTSARSIDDYALIGWDEGMYKHDVQRFYRLNTGGLPNMLLGIHVLLLAIATNNNIGPPIKIVVATKRGMYEIPAKHVTDLQERVDLFNRMLDSITLQLSDTSIPTDEFRDYVTKFRDQVVLLHDHYVNDHVWTSFSRVLFDKEWQSDPMQEMPPSSVVTRTKEEGGSVVEFKHSWTFAEDLLDDELNKELDELNKD
jgi:hypothetical protein